MPRPRKTIDDAVILAAALEGLKLQKQKLDEQIQEVKAKLDKKGVRKPGAAPRIHSSVDHCPTGSAVCTATMKL